MSRDASTEIFELCRYAMECLLSEEHIEGKEVTGFLINSNEVTLYTGGEMEEKNKLITVVEGNNIIQVNLLDDYVSSYPRISLSEVLGQKKVKGKTPDLNYILALIERENKEMIKNPSDVLGQNIRIQKQKIYAAECESSRNDPRRDLDKLAKYQTASMFDYAVFCLQSKGYREGMYRMSNLSVYGYDEDKNEYIKIGTMPAEALKEQYLKHLDFRAVSFRAKRKEDDSDMNFLTCPSIDPIKVSKELKKALNSKTGIVILDELMAVDLVNSDFTDGDGAKSIWYSGGALSKRNPDLFISALESKKKSTALDKMAGLKYNIIIDDSGILSTQEIVQLSQRTLVVIGKNLKDVRVFCNALEMSGPELYKQFIDNIVFMGSIYCESGMEIGDTSKHLLKTRDFYSFGEVLDDNKIINSVLNTLQSKEVSEVTVRGENAIVVMKDSIEKKISTPKPITDKQIINFLWKITGQSEHKTMIGLLNDEGNFTTIYCQQGKKENEEMLLKINVFKAGEGLNMRASRLNTNISLKDTKEDEPGTIKIYMGSRGTGKTHRLKAAAYVNSKYKRILIVDRDFDFDTREFKFAKEVTVVRDGGTITPTLIKSFNPEVMVINTPVTGKELFDFIENLELNTKIYIAATYDIMEEMNEEFKDSMSKEKVCESINARVTTINLSKGR